MSDGFLAGGSGNDPVSICICKVIPHPVGESDQPAAKTRDPE